MVRSEARIYLAQIVDADLGADEAVRGGGNVAAVVRRLAEDAPAPGLAVHAKELGVGLVEQVRHAVEHPEITVRYTANQYFVVRQHCEEMYIQFEWGQDC
jgi:hypothetical protein